MANRERDKNLVTGYARQYHQNVPQEIISLIFVWYHLELFIFKTGPRSRLNEDKTIITLDDNPDQSYDTCYGSISMPSINNMKYEYEIKVLRCGSTHHVGIGIDDARCKHTNSYFIGNGATKNYGFQCWNARKSCIGDFSGTKYGKVCIANENNQIIVRMIYDSNESTLAFIIDGEDYGIAYSDIAKEEGFEYRLAIYSSGDGSVELLHYSSSTIAIE